MQLQDHRLGVASQPIAASFFGSDYTAFKPQPNACCSATPAPIRPEYGAVTSQTGMPLR